MVGKPFLRRPLRHMHAPQSIVLQRLTSILPLARLRAADTLRRERAGGLARLVGVVVGVFELEEGLGGDFAEEEEAGIVRQMGVAVVGRL